MEEKDMALELLGKLDAYTKKLDELAAVAQQRGHYNTSRKCYIAAIKLTIQAEPLRGHLLDLEDEDPSLPIPPTPAPVMN